MSNQGKRRRIPPLKVEPFFSIEKSGANIDQREKQDFAK
jgi:hypothetical protein